MAKRGRPITCECGECQKCKKREYMRNWYAKKSPEERREVVARRDPEAVKRNDRKRYYRNWENRRAVADEYSRTHRETVREANERWVKRNPDKRSAQITAGNARRDGKLQQGPCEFESTGECRGRIEMHHDDYSKPLEVRWLCAGHHGETRRK